MKGVYFMRKRLLIIVFLIVMLSVAILLTGCGNQNDITTDDKTQAYIVSATDFNQESETVLTLSRLVQEDSINLDTMLTVSKYAIFEVFTDEACTNGVASSNIPLVEGENKLYVKVTSDDNMNSTVYTLIINRETTVDMTQALITSAIGWTEEYEHFLRLVWGWGGNSDINDIRVSPFATFEIFTDEACTNQVPKDNVPVVPGANMLYLKVTSGDETNSNVYTLLFFSSVGDKTQAFITSATGFTAQAGDEFTFVGERDSCFLNLDVLIEVSPFATYEVFADAACTDKKASDLILDWYNPVYVKVTSGDGTSSNVYTFIVNSTSDRSRAHITCWGGMARTFLPEEELSLVYSDWSEPFGVLDLYRILAVSDYASYEAFADEACTISLGDNDIPLIEGENTLYIKVTSGDGTNSNVYKVIVNYVIDRSQAEITYATGWNGDGINFLRLVWGHPGTHDFTTIFQVSRFATFEIFTDKACTNQVPKDNVPFVEGINILYLKVTSGDGTNSNVYTLLFSISEADMSQAEIVSAIGFGKDYTYGNYFLRLLQLEKNENINLAALIEVSEYATFEVFTDKDCTNQVPKDNVPLVYGGNIFYVKVTSGDKTNSRLYTLSIPRGDKSQAEIVSATGFNEDYNNFLRLVTYVQGDSINLDTMIKVSPYAWLQVYTDEACTNMVASNNVPLVEGTNILHVKVSAPDGVSYYTLLIFRKST